MMHWRKHGLLWRPDGTLPWARSHAMVPTPLVRDDGTVRVYVSCCDAEGRASVGWVDLDARDPRRVLAQSEAPLLQPGKPGTFDENGVLATCVVPVGPGMLHLYYVGFELGTRIRYRLLSGLAVSRDGGASFSRVQETPILERSPEELYFRGGPCVRVENGRFRMWYVAGSAWTEIQGKSMPVYDLRHLESADGIAWPRAGEGGLDLDWPEEHGLGRPWVVRSADGGYELYYSIRRRSLAAYRLGYATSADGRRWIRRDAELGLDVGAEGFDRTAIMYAAPFTAHGRTWCLYNGDGFGREGFALAERLDR